MTNTSGYPAYSIGVSVSAGTHTFALLFDNDAYGGSGADRNAYIDYVAIAAPTTSLLQNGSFEQTGPSWLAPWHLIVSAGAQASISQVGTTRIDGVYSTVATVTRSASSDSAVQLQQAGLALQAGQQYIIAFGAKASVSRPMRVVLQQTTSPFTVLWSQAVNLTTSWHPFTYTYTPSAAQANVFLGFNLATSTGQVWLDSAAVAIGATGAPGSPSKGVGWDHAAEYWAGAHNLNGIASDLADMNTGGMSWARTHLPYTTTPYPAFDMLVQKAQARHIQLLVVVANAPPYNDLGTDADRATYKAWLAQMVNRYKYWVKYWEIMNEPSLHYEWNLDDTATSDPTQYAASVHRYVLHLQDSYQTIKANDPTATVLIGGISEWTLERYVYQMIAEKAYQYFDILSFHAFGPDPTTDVGRLNSLWAHVAAQAGLAARPIWVTETGFSTSWPNRADYVPTEDQKAAYLTQTMQLLHRNGARFPLFWYTLHENSLSSGHGLTLKDPSTLRTTYYPAFDAYKNLVFN